MVIPTNICRAKVSEGSLFDIIFICHDSQPMLVACGDDGIFIFRWSDIMLAIDRNAIIARKRKAGNLFSAREGRFFDSTTTCGVRLAPRAILKPHPSGNAPTEVNSVSYDESHKKLYGAAGDLFGGYVWDLDSSKLLGTLGGFVREFGTKGHSDYLHSIKSIPPTCSASGSNYCVLTGSEDGQVGIWDGKQQKLIEMLDCKLEMNNHCQSYSSDIVPYAGAATSWSVSTSLWVSCLDVSDNGNWIAVGGGADHNLNGAVGSKSLSSRGNANKSIVSDNGFVAIWNLPTRSISSGYATSETIHQLIYHPKDNYIVSVGNEGVVSFWNKADVSIGKIKRSWLKLPSAYSISINQHNRLTVVGGVGPTIDCFTGLGIKSFDLII